MKKAIVFDLVEHINRQRACRSTFFSSCAGLITSGSAFIVCFQVVGGGAE